MKIAGTVISFVIAMIIVFAVFPSLITSIGTVTGISSISSYPGVAVLVVVIPTILIAGLVVLAMRTFGLSSAAGGVANRVRSYGRRRRR